MWAVVLGGVFPSSVGRDPVASQFRGCTDLLKEVTIVTWASLDGNQLQRSALIVSLFTHGLSDQVFCYEKEGNRALACDGLLSLVCGSTSSVD